MTSQSLAELDSAIAPGGGHHGHAENPGLATSVKLYDTKRGYGWVSIALHWLTAAIVIAMWTIGTMSQGTKPDEHVRLVGLHTTIGIGVYALLWGRIIWRFKVGHPGALPGQGRVIFSIAKYFHFLFLIAIGVMLVSGPLMVWAAGASIQFFDFTIPGPFKASMPLREFLRAVHGITASVIAVGTLLHLLGTLKHVIVNKDGTFDKMMIADGDRRT